MEEIFAERLLDFALKFGASFLESGAEIYRAEDTIKRIFSSFGVQNPEAFAITSLITASFEYGDKTISRSKRIGEMSHDLTAINAFNALSRDLCSHKIELDEAFERYEKIIDNKKKASNINIKYLLGAFLAAGAFSAFTGGSLLDFAISGAIGILMAVFIRITGDFINAFAKVLIISFLAGMITIIIQKIGIPIMLDKVIIGEIMIIIPGLALGNSVLELFEGDTISGTLRLIKALLTAVFIAFGFALSFIAFGGLL